MIDGLTKKDWFDISRMLVIINVAVYFVMLASTGFKQFIIFRPNVLLDWGANIGAFSVTGQYWRLFTSMFVHASIFHLLLNMYALIVFGPEVSRIFGAWRFLLIYVLSGLAGALSSIIWNPIQTSAGASAALMGIVGAMFAYVVSKGDKDRAAKYAHPFVFFGIVCASICGGFFVPEIDNAAHIGGLFGGFVCGILLLPQTYGDKGKVPVYIPISILTLISLMALTFTIGTARADRRIDTYRIAGSAMANLNARKFQEAYNDYDQLLRLDLNSSYFIGRSAALIGLKKFGKALEDCNKAVALSPKDTLVYVARARAFHDLEKYDKAIADFDRVIKMAPNQPGGYNGRAWTEIALGKYDLALKDVDKALKLNSEMADALDTRGLVYYCLNEDHKAMLDYEKGILIKPEEGACHYHLAMVYERAAEKDKAEREYKKAEELKYVPDAWEENLRVREKEAVLEAGEPPALRP